MRILALQISPLGFLTALALISILFIVRWRSKKMRYQPALLYSDLNSLQTDEKSPRLRFIKVPDILKSLALLFFLCALCHPVLNIPTTKKNKKEDPPKKEEPKPEGSHLPTEGIAIYFVLDYSGSMQAEMGPLDGFTSKKRQTRIDVLKNLTERFIVGDEKAQLSGRKNDLLGLVSFARVPKVLVPLTLDHEIVSEKLKELTTQKELYEEGTAIGYAIYKTSHLIAATEHYAKQIEGDEKPSYDIQSTIMILVTDGAQNPHTDDFNHPKRSMGVIEAAQFAKEKGIKLYIINLEPNLAFAQYQFELDELKKAAELTGGQFFLVNSVYQLQKIYRVIDQIEKVKQKDPKKRQVIVQEEIKNAPEMTFDQKELFALLIKIGLVFLVSALLLETTLLRRVP